MKPATSIGLLLTLLVGAAVLQAETHRFAPRAFVTTFSGSHAPVLRIKSGDTVVTATANRYGADADAASMAAAAPPQTGPFFVEGAEPGDLLVVTIERLEPNQPVGYSTVGPVRERGACGSALAASRHQPLRLDHRQGARCGPVRSRGGDARRELGLALQHGGVRDAAAPHPRVDRRRPCGRGGARGDRRGAVWRQPERRRGHGGRARDAAGASAGRAAVPGPWPGSHAATVR